MALSRFGLYQALLLSLELARVRDRLQELEKEIAACPDPEACWPCKDIMIPEYRELLNREFDLLAHTPAFLISDPHA